MAKTMAMQETTKRPALLSAMVELQDVGQHIRLNGKRAFISAFATSQVCDLSDKSFVTAKLLLP